MNIETNNGLMEEIVSAWKDRIGDGYLGYRGISFEETGARPPNCERCFRLECLFVPDDRFPSLSCDMA